MAVACGGMVAWVVVAIWIGRDVRAMVAGLRSGQYVGMVGGMVGNLPTLYHVVPTDTHGCHCTHINRRAQGRKRQYVMVGSEPEAKKAQERGSEAEGRKGQYVIYY